ncbi:ABC transporter substrate-binding protein, partial [Leptothoe spongobia TAU-MAC 1115]|nr:ABC transporter substrate-binding protein [Leptothoe spongobia TAU-MAC 1115]
MKSHYPWLRRISLSCALTFSAIFIASCSAPSNSENADGSSEAGSVSSGKGDVIRISIGTQDQVINTAVGGATVRELGLLEKHLPTTGKY